MENHPFLAINQEKLFIFPMFFLDNLLLDSMAYMLNDQSNHQYYADVSLT